MEKQQSVFVWYDWGGPGIWVMGEDGNLRSAEYEQFALPEEIITRFKYWENWFNDSRPGYNDEEDRFDQKLYDAYGLSLAIDLKRLFKEKHRVFRGYSGDKDCVEIVLVKREWIEGEENGIVPMAVPYKK